MAILDLFFPKRCLECKNLGKYICSDCLKKVKKGGWNSAWAYSVWRYKGVIRKAILALKYRYSTEIAGELAEHIVRVLKKDNVDLEKACLIPIPLHKLRYNTRGFNQSEEVGKAVASKMDWKFEPNILQRIKITASQTELSRSQRRENLKGVFSVNTKKDRTNFKNVVLFDDVLTTGSTLLEAYRTLKKEGVQRILCLTIAR